MINLEITNNSAIFLKESFETFNKEKLKLSFKENFDKLFTYTLSYSFDYQNWSDEFTYDRFPDLNELFTFQPLNVYISINIHEIDFYTHNVDTSKSKSVDISNHHKKYISQLENITYGGKVFSINDIETSIQNKSVISKTPKWNLYDGNSVSVKNWLNQCRAISEMYGHCVIWFHTNPKETNHTLVNHHLKDIVSIKKIMINLPNNEIPQDRTTYTEWDIQLEGEFVTNIVDSLFKQAFGEDEIPLQKDFIYFPLMNKMYRVSSVQPKNSFMGKLGWWEVFFTKFEDDNSITNNIKTDELLDNYDKLTDFSFIEEIQNDIIDNSLYDEEYIIKSNEEIQTANENYTNKAMDSIHYVDVKDSEYFRELMDNRIDIVSVNPEHNAFPVSMYNFQNINNREIAMRWLVGKGTNKRQYFSETFRFITNIVFLKKFVGELFDFDNFLTLSINRKNELIITDNINQQEFIISDVINEKEFYQFELIYNKIPNQTKTQITINIYKLEKGKKIHFFNTIYIVDLVNKIDSFKQNIKYIHLYGGKYLINDVYIYLDGEKMIQDNVNPIMKTNTNL